MEDLNREPVGASVATDRVTSLDVFRGLTIAGMILVNNPGTWDAIYSPLEHSKWDGLTPTDLVFPFFLFLNGKDDQRLTHRVTCDSPKGRRQHTASRLSYKAQHEI